MGNYFRNYFGIGETCIYWDCMEWNGPFLFLSSWYLIIRSRSSRSLYLVLPSWPNFSCRCLTARQLFNPVYAWFVFARFLFLPQESRSLEYGWMLLLLRYALLAGLSELLEYPLPQVFVSLFVLLAQSFVVFCISDSLDVLGRKEEERKTCKQKLKKTRKKIHHRLFILFM